MIVGNLMNDEIVVSGESLFIAFASRDGTGIIFRTVTLALVTLKAAFVCKGLTFTRWLIAHVWTIVLVLVFSMRTLVWGIEQDIIIS